mmetsp:Transcript_67797/g.150174  ORF Transcript_67797/g.150174 Transcript_67797/m.150174 type:complete len:735 (-) Transcript_67797:10-2214(-)
MGIQKCWRCGLAVPISLVMLWSIATLGGWEWQVAAYDEAEICPETASPGSIDLCGGAEGCMAGPVSAPCVCAEGYFPRLHTLTFTGTGSQHQYRCCSGDGASNCGEASYLLVFGIALLCWGLLGTAICTALLYVDRVPERPLTCYDHAVEQGGAQYDGVQLHQTVPMNRWTVTLPDVQQFRRLVRRAVADGRIRPTELDAFDPTDFVKGPTMYTVNEQYIKPVTKAAGSVSWALMKHPQGLECDLFITHGWAEGVFEFVDKLISSWPQEASAAYVCFLSNPQNLDIANLITRPQDSPFAKALASAKQVLVIPNQTLSIYTRIWCVYEAFLAISWGKPIHTLAAPTTGFGRRVARMCFFTKAVLGAAIALMSLLPPGLSEEVGQLEGIFFATLALWAAFVMFLLRGGWHDSMVAQVAVCVFAVLLGIHRLPSAYQKSFLHFEVLPNLLQAPWVAGALEADRLLITDARKQVKLLSQGFRGIRHAHSSNVMDKERIFQEIKEKGCEQGIDEAVAILLQTTDSTPEMRKLIQHAGVLGPISTWSRSVMAASLLWWTIQPTEVFVRYLCHDASPAARPFGWAVFVVTALETMAYWLLLYFLSPLRRSLLIQTQLFLMGLVLTVPALGLKGMVSDVLLCFVVQPVLLILAAAGPARLSQLPLGAGFVRALYFRLACRRVRLARAQSGASELTAADGRGSPDAITGMVAGMPRPSGDAMEQSDDGLRAQHRANQKTRISL